jgi:hypothetical protein
MKRRWLKDWPWETVMVLNSAIESAARERRDRKEKNLGNPTAKACIHLPGEAVGSQPNQGIPFSMCALSSFAAIPTAVLRLIRMAVVSSAGFPIPAACPSSGSLYFQ